MKMAMRNNLNSAFKSSSYKQVKRPNGKYGHMSLNSGISKCDICGKNYQRMKLFDHVRESHRQYFCIVCRARFKIHKDLIGHIQNIHQLIASDNLNKSQDTFSDSVNKRYFAQPLLATLLPIPPIANSQFSNSSSEDDELLLDNPDVLDIVLGTKNCKQYKEEVEISEIINDIIKNVIDKVKYEEVFDSTLQELSCSDVSVTDEFDNQSLKKLGFTANETNHLLSSDVYQKNCDNILSNNINTSENDDLFDHINTFKKSPSNDDPKRTLSNVEEEFKIGIKSMSIILSEKSPWVNGPDTQQDINSTKNENDLQVMALTLDQKLIDMKLNAILKECIRTSCLTCVYCHNSTCIAVNAKQLALHMIEKHRFMTVKNESSEDVVNILKSNLTALDGVYLNSENFDSTDESYHSSFNNTFYCFNCQFTSKQMKEVNSHKRSVHSRKTYDCIMCKITFSNYGELHCHLCPGVDLGVWQNLTFRCLFCGQGQIPSAFRCMVHLRKVHNACDYCLETFPNQQSLALHVNKHKMRHMCLKCNITYLSKKDIFEHMFWKHNRDSKECKLCLTKKWPYTYHFCIPPAIFTCDECKRTFSNALLLRVHERWHSDNVPYECKTCHYKFISKKLLLKHENIHKELISPIKKKKKKKKKKGDDYNLPPLNLSSDSDAEKTPCQKLEKHSKSPSPSGNNYWDYVSKQKKELVHIALLDHDYTLLPTSQSEIIKSPQYIDELSPIVNGSTNILNNSLNNSACQRSSCSSHCNSSSSSTSCGSNCSCSSSCSSSCDSDNEEKKKPIVESPKKHKKKKKERKIKVLSAKKIANFNLCALESDLESDFSNTDNEEYYDINPVPLHPEISTILAKDIPQLKQETCIEDVSISPKFNSTTISCLSIPNNHSYKLSKPLNKPHQYSDIESQKIGNSEIIAFSDNECKATDKYDVFNSNYSSAFNNLLPYSNLLLPTENQECNENNLNQISNKLFNGNNNLDSIKKELNICHEQEVESNYYTQINSKKRNTLTTKRLTKRKSKLKASRPLSQVSKDVLTTPYPPSLNSSSTCTTNIPKIMSPNDTRQSKRQPKKRKFFGYDSSDEDQIPNGDSSVVQQCSPYSLPLSKKKQKRKSKIVSPLQIQPTITLTQSQQARPIVDVRISKTAVLSTADDSDSDSGNLVIELPKFVEQKAVQSTERLYCHCRCPYDEVSEMIACDNPNCRVEWFHFDCVGITVAPKGNWYCPDCR